MHETVLGEKKVSLLERCPLFRAVLRERFHCIRIDKVPLYIHMLCCRYPREEPGRVESEVQMSQQLQFLSQTHHSHVQVPRRSGSREIQGSLLGDLLTGEV